MNKTSQLRGHRKIPEKLLDTNLGQLRVPKAFKDAYGTPKNYPNPDWRMGRENSEDIELVYIFKKEELERR